MTTPTQRSTVLATVSHGWSVVRAAAGRRPSYAILGGIVAFALFVRLWQLANVQVLWFDEITSYYVPFLLTHGYGNVQTWGLLRTDVPSSTTEFYQLIYSSIIGMIVPGAAEANSTFWVRIPAVACGIALIFLLFGLGSELYDRRVGLVAAALGAVVPWTFYWSRFAGVIAPLELWPVAAIYVALLAVRLRSERLLMLSLVFGAFTVYTHEAGIVALLLLVLPFWWICARKFVAGAPGAHSVDSIVRSARFCVPYLLVLLILLLPLAAFELQPSAAGTSLVGSGQLVWERCRTASCSASSFLYNAGLSWSPDFFAISGGVDGAQAAGFLPHISIGGAWQSGGGFTGMLTGIGILVYPALILAALRWPRQLARGNATASWLAILVALSYTAVGGVVYYDNPNAPRLAFAAGFLVVFIGWLLLEVVDFLVGLGQRWIRSARPAAAISHAPATRMRAVAVAVGVALVIAPAGGAYLYDYFEEFPSISSNYFYPQIQEVGEMLSADQLWSHPIVVQCPSDLIYILPAELAFYDPVKPPAGNIYVFNGSVASNTGPLSAQPAGQVFVSMVDTGINELRTSGIPATTLTSVDGISIYWISGQSSSHETLDSVAGWVNAPGENFTASTLPWNITQSPANGTIGASTVPGGYAVLAHLPQNASASTWQITAALPERLGLPQYNFLSVTWNFSTSNSSDFAYLQPLYWNGTSLVPGAARAVFPDTVVNVAPIASTNLTLAGVRVGANISAGTSQLLVISNVSAHGVTAVSSTTCTRGQSVVLGSPQDVLVPQGTGLNYTDVNSTLFTTLCLPADPPNSPATFYAELSVMFISNLTAPVTFAATASGYETTLVGGVTGPPGTVATIYAGLTGPGPTYPVNVRVAVNFAGQILIRGLSLVAFTAGPPPAAT